VRPVWAVALEAQYARLTRGEVAWQMDSAAITEVARRTVIMRRRDDALADRAGRAATGGGAGD
jgi:hypothetical protein